MFYNQALHTPGRLLQELNFCTVIVVKAVYSLKGLSKETFKFPLSSVLMNNCYNNGFILVIFIYRLIHIHILFLFLHKKCCVVSKRIRHKYVTLNISKT